VLLRGGLQASVHTGLGAVVVALAAGCHAVLFGVGLRNTKALPDTVDAAVVGAMRGERLLEARLAREAFLADASAICAATVAVAILGTGTGGAEVTSVAGLAHTCSVLGAAVLADGFIAVGTCPLRNAAARALCSARAVLTAHLGPASRARTILLPPPLVAHTNALDTLAMAVAAAIGSRASEGTAVSPSVVAGALADASRRITGAL